MLIWITTIVLILVLLDDTHRRTALPTDDACGIAVLILVLLDDTHRLSWILVAYVDDKKGLNPCSLGRYSPTLRERDLDAYATSLNPCSLGRYSPTKDGQWILTYKCLNPCSLGRYSPTIEK